MRFQVTREFYIPKGSTKITDKDGLGTVYIYSMGARNPKGPKPAAMAFAGKAIKPTWHYTFGTEAHRERRVTEFFAGLRAHRDMVAKHRQERNQPHTLKVGAVITNSWGYDQTNVDWYAVVQVSAHYVWLQPIAADMVPSEGCGPMSGRCTVHIDVTNPDPSTWGVRFTSDKRTKHKASSWNGTNSVTMRHGSGSEWKGGSQYVSWYA